jgi:glycosyltransferase involved in cell wall biosynthesis
MTSRAGAPSAGRFVIDARYVEPKPSGIGRYVEALIERLPRLAPSEHFHLWAHPARPEPVKAPNVSASPVSAPSDGLRTLLTPSLLGELGVDDVIHLPFSILGRGLRCASVVTIHDLMWLEQPELVEGRPFLRRVRQPYYRRGMRWALQHATRLIAVSEATRARMLALVPECEERVSVTHNAADVSFAPPADAAAAARAAAQVIGSSAPYFLVVGKNEPYKGHEVAIAAFARAAVNDELLVMIQRSSGGQKLVALADRLGIGQRVRWLPAVSSEQLVALVQSAHALLQPSLVEGFGIPAVEAMAAGCPVIGSDTPALLEVMGNAGLHARAGDAEALARAIDALREPGLREQLRARGRARARDFDWERTAAATLEVYREARRDFSRKRRETNP